MKKVLRLSHSKQGAFDNGMGQNSCQPERVAARIGDGRVARLGNGMTIAFTGRLALTNSGYNAHVFHHVRDSCHRGPPYHTATPGTLTR
ncbi:MAG TPA: hypothetical protein VHQ88_02570, partial [Burkholderiales bacterium]|nr:hypothetical protein [Burkholderiales bacterium]